MTADNTWIVKQAKTLGFDLCGVVRAEKFPELERFEEWLERGYAGEMKYLEDKRRRDPALVMENLRSVIVCALNYNTEHAYSIEAAAGTACDDEPRGWISRYAWGDDYHKVMLAKLNELTARMKGLFQEPFLARAYADTGPIAERIFAKHAGLGWLGKNTLLLNETLGSWFFLGVILTTLELDPTLGPAEAPPADLCGQCRQCLDACPTGALVEPYVLDARRCISYLTIELRGSIPEEFREPMGWHVFGCDICQDVCPFNRDGPVTKREEFQPREMFGADAEEMRKQIPQGLKPEEESAFMSELKLRPPKGNPSSSGCRESLFEPGLEWLAGMGEEKFQKILRESPVKRTKWTGLVRNACLALGNSGVRPRTEEWARIEKLLRRLSGSEIFTIAESARWALSRIQQDGHESAV
jgi:epoxyqueuosine reductase